eukprot:TRINITY_DN10800_c0_g1_i1.p1 TRINITY_DN10800_c0_g1~~TRINITY_DN10800_c0_g1_i1.p1  ORF type:complete len:103 (+),score=18.76 TRINITY_DN10800_c0_g1_i1:185-493(+)
MAGRLLGRAPRRMCSGISRHELERISGMARLNIRSAEDSKLVEDVREIVRFLDVIKAVEVKDLEPLHTLQHEPCYMREDQACGDAQGEGSRILRVTAPEFKG